MIKESSMLILSREKFPTNRAVISKLWCNLLPSAGFKVTWLAETNINYSRKMITKKNFTLLPFFIPNNFSVFKSTFYSLVIKFRLTNFLIRSNMVHSIQVRNGIFDGFLSLFLGKIYNIPYFFHLSSLHGFEDYDLHRSQSGWQRIKFKLRAFLFPMFYRIILRNSHIVQPISTYMSKYLVDQKVSNSEKLFPLPISAVKNEINLKKTKMMSKNPTLIYVGSLGAERDIDFILKLFSLVSNKDSKFRFKIVGVVEKDSSRSNIISKIESYGIRERTKIFFNINPRKVPDHIRSSDIGISPIKPIPKYLVSTPTKMIEYLTFGLPVVCNNEIFDQRKIIEESGAGLSVDYSVDSFCKSVINIGNNKDKYSRMSKKGKEWLFANRTYEKLLNPLLEHYRFAIEGKVKL